MFAEIIIDIKNKQVNRLYTYRIPSHLENQIKIGHRVYVSFGNLKRVGFVINIIENTNIKNIKDILDIVDVNNILDKEFIDLAKYISDNNFTYYYLALDQMIPSILKIKYQKVCKIIDSSLLNDELKNIFKNKKELIIENQNLETQKILYNAYRNNLIEIESKYKKRKDDDLIYYVHLNNNDIKYRSKLKMMLINYLNEINNDIELNTLISEGYNKKIINELKDDNIINIYTKVNKIEELDNDNIILDDSKLNLEQEKAFNQIKYDKFNTYLLHGITGSGKTLVYIKAINEILKLNKQCIMLVPEISLTPQITNILYSKFKDNIAILHSRLTPKEKYLEWKRIIDNKVNIVVGARSAIFAPLKNIGLIIIDECHEESYIQSNNPKYDAIDIAIKRSKYHNIPLILGSATPKISQYYKALSEEYELLELKTRYNEKELPKCEVIDLKEELKNGNKSVLSYRLQEELIDCYKKHEQAILFLNRRGHSTFVQCRSCGNVIKCPHCDISLTYHERGNYLKCHHCGYSIPNLSYCPKCNSDKIRFVGTGTEKIYNEVLKLLPMAKILRLDLDSINSLSDYEYVYNQFKNHEADILIGTQMVCKGLDFKDCTLVGILNADLAINYPRYDSNEVAYNLIEQVSGRAGRSELQGKVIIQTYMPNHFVIRYAKNHDYDSFFKEELQNRKLTNMPPYSELIEIMISSTDLNILKDECNKIIKFLKLNEKESNIYGPIEAPIFKIKDKYRYLIQIECKSNDLLEKINYLYPKYQDNDSIELDLKRM